MTQQNQITLDGAVKGHPFFGNQHVSASGESHTAVRSSQKAKHAEQHGDPKAQKKAHRVAHHAHMAAAEGAQTATTKKYHKTMAKFHGGRAGMTLDGVEGWDGISLDAVEDFQDSIVGQIWKSGTLQGHAVIGGDGKAMVFVGESAYDRVQFKSSVDGQMREATWSDDDAADMVEWLLVPTAGYVEIEKITVNGTDYLELSLDTDGAKSLSAQSLEKAGGNLFDAAKDVFQNTLKGRFVKTKIGNVLMTGSGWREMKSGLRSDDLRARSIPYIPVVLSSGSVGEAEELYKERTDGTLCFHPFTHTVDLGDVIVDVLLKVAEREDHQLVYHMISEAAMDSAETTNPPCGGSVRDEVFRGSGVPSEPTTEPESTSSSLPTVDSIMAQGKSPVNIIILKVVEKATGQRLSDLEDAPVPVSEPTATPDPVPAAADPKTEDRAFFMSVIDGSHPEILEPELADKLAQAYERHAGDAEITSLFMQAGNAYTQAMLAATEGV